MSTARDPIRHTLRCWCHIVPIKFQFLKGSDLHAWKSVNTQMQDVTLEKLFHHSRMSHAILPLGQAPLADLQIQLIHLILRNTIMKLPTARYASWFQITLENCFKGWYYKSVFNMFSYMCLLLTLTILVHCREFCQFHCSYWINVCTDVSDDEGKQRFFLLFRSNGQQNMNISSKFSKK